MKSTAEVQPVKARPVFFSVTEIRPLMAKIAAGIEDLKSDDPLRKNNRQAKAAQQAMDMIVDNHMGLVFAAIKKFWGRAKAVGIEEPDIELKNSGVAGLMKAIERYECDRGTKFSTYAKWWVDQAIQEELNGTEATRGPVSLTTCAVQDKGKIAKQQKANPELSREAAAEQAGVTVDMAKNLSKATAARRVSLGMRIGEEGTLGQVMEDKTAQDPATSLTSSYNSEFVRRLLRRALEEKVISRRGHEVLCMRKGIDQPNGESLTLDKVGKILRITRERVRQIESVAFKKFQNYVLTVVKNPEDLF